MKLQHFIHGFTPLLPSLHLSPTGTLQMPILVAGLTSSALAKTLSPKSMISLLLWIFPFLPIFLHFLSSKTLIITDANLTGSISPDIRYCIGLTVVDINSNSLVGNIPSSIGQLRNLEGLILYSNQLTGQIPKELGNCINLKDLLLQNNKLKW